MIQIFPLEINFRAAEIFRHLFGVIKRRRAVRVIVKKIIQFRAKFRVVLIAVIGGFKLIYGVHQRFGDILSAVNAEAPAFFTHLKFLL